MSLFKRCLASLKRLDLAINGRLIHSLGGYTFAEVKGVEDFYITERDKDREKRETLQERLAHIEAELMDIRDRKLIAHSVPDDDWNAASMKRTLDDLTSRFDKLTNSIDRRRKEASERARQQARDANGKFISSGGT